MPPSTPFRPATVLQPLALALAALTAALAPPAQAGVVVQTADFKTGGEFRANLVEPGAPRFGVQLTGSRSSAGLLSFNHFDGSLGTLTSVTWELLDTTYAFYADHSAQVTSIVGILNAFTFNVLGGGGGNIGGTALMGTTDRSFNLGGTATNACGFSSPIGLPGSPGCTRRTAGETSVASDTLGADITAFLGAGMFAEEVGAGFNWNDRIDVAGLGLDPILGPLPSIVEGAFKLSGSLRLTYRFDETPPASVPEPGTLWMVAGLLPLIALRRRAK